MRRIYQQEWLGLDFASFTQPSSRHLAGAGFYQAFYQTLFQRYHTWEDLDPQWLALKRAVAEFIFSTIIPGSAVLSVGCGLGWIEHCLLELSHGGLHLEVTEVADSALKWIKGEIPADRLHLGIFPQCIPAGRKYDLVYMSSLDYCLDQPALVELLRAVRGLLANRGQCLLVSFTFEHPRPLWREALSRAKREAQALLESLGLHHRGQFWGWARSRREFHQVFREAGLRDLKEGFIDVGDKFPVYRIAGQGNLD